MITMVKMDTLKKMTMVKVNTLKENNYGENGYPEENRMVKMDIRMNHMILMIKYNMVKKSTKELQIFLIFLELIIFSIIYNIYLVEENILIFIYLKYITCVKKIISY